jgi:hypothetical protein
VNKKQVADTYKIWEPFAKSANPPSDGEGSDVRFWLRDASPDDLWRAMRSVYLRGKENVPF